MIKNFWPKFLVLQLALVIIGLLLFFWLSGIKEASSQPVSSEQQKVERMMELQTAIFAGGCFWCMEHPFDKLDGVHDVLSGYSGGHVENPGYKQVSAGVTGHKEVIQVTYDPAKIDYETLLDVYWRNIDPFDPAGQFCDRGEPYQSAIYVANDNEGELAEESKRKMAERFGQDVATQILPAAPFYEAEAYHQDYYKNNPYRYKFYRGRCGRDKRLKAVWGKEAGGKGVVAD